jgi:hypothetical protein
MDLARMRGEKEDKSRLRMVKYFFFSVRAHGKMQVLQRGSGVKNGKITLFSIRARGNMQVQRRGSGVENGKIILFSIRARANTQVLRRGSGIVQLASGSTFGSDQPICLQLLGSDRSKDVLEGIAMELEDCLYPLLRQVGLFVSL